ncbi:MAG: class I SAM-dependent methyltransferase [Chloroflexota bacterium]
MQPSTKQPCPNCCTHTLETFYEVSNVPVHSVLLLKSRQQAVEYPKGDLSLAFCHTCGFITNEAFDPEAHEYGCDYDPTQGFSPTFNAFHKELAVKLVEKYQLHGQTILEIGCGQGEFITLLCEIGNNIGIGFDPAYLPERNTLGDISQAGITFIQDFYSEKYANYRGDFVVCKMTLEHIPKTSAFVNMVRRAVDNHLDTTVFFQVPNARYVLGDVAFWDIYYEHCSYFSLGSLGYVLRHAGFEILDLWADYDDQYIMAEARPIKGSIAPPHPNEELLGEISDDVTHFRRIYPQKHAYWQDNITKWRSEGKKVVLWGGGSKAVAFLTTLNLQTRQLKYVVDINPRKAGTYITGTGQKIISPKFLEIYHPDIVIVMNPVYEDEIRHVLYEMDLHPQLITV